MERVTIDDLFCNISMCEVPGIEGPGCNGMCDARRVYEKCRDYEIAEADGRLVRLPCKVGDTVYWYDKDEGVQEWVARGVAVKKDGFYLIDEDGNLDKIGTQYAMLTREAAEAALAKEG